MRSRTELLAALVGEEETSLDELLDSQVEGDVHVDWDDEAAAITIFVNGWGTTLAFPFAVRDLWEVLDELDRAAGEDPSEENELT